MTHETRIEREEYIAREDVMVGAEVIDRINASRRRLRDQDQPLAASEIQELYELLGQCAIELSDLVHARRENELRLMTIVRLLRQMSFVEVPEAAEVVEAPMLAQRASTMAA